MTCARPSPRWRWQRHGLAAREVKETFVLPKEKTPTKTSLTDLSVLLYSGQKFGKSTFCAEAEGALFLATEPGLNHLEVYQEPIHTWEDMLTKCGEIAAGDHFYKTIVIDTIDQAYRLCVEYMNKKHKVEHESDLGFGKGYALINNEFYRVLNKLAMLPYGLLLISHAQEKEIETRTGKITRITPTLPDKARKAVLGLVDVILFGDFETATGPDGKPVVRRVLRTKPSPHFEAGDRTKRLPPTIELDYAKFVRAFEAGQRVVSLSSAVPIDRKPAPRGLSAPELVGGVLERAPSEETPPM